MEITKPTITRRAAFKVRMYKLVRKVIIGFILACVVNFVLSYFFHPPKVFSLNRDNADLIVKYKLLQDKIDESRQMLDNIKKRDHNMYRSIFALDTISFHEIQTLSDNKRKPEETNRYAPLVEQTRMNVNALSRLVYMQSVSLDTLQYLAKDKEKMAESVPAIWPIDKTKLKSNIGMFGMRTHPIFKIRMPHTGIDMPAAKGVEVYATARGVVSSAKVASGYGNIIEIDHGYGYKSRYAHLSKMNVKNGQKVERGEYIGRVGTNGWSTGPHLHYEVMYKNQFVNPINYISKGMSTEEFKDIIESAKETTYE